VTGGLRKLRKAAHERSANAEDMKVQGWTGYTPAFERARNCNARYPRKSLTTDKLARWLLAI
jgi:hypothetical protein